MHVGTDPSVLLSHLQKRIIINRYLDCWDFCTKNIFGEIMNLGRLLEGEEEYNFTPATYILPKDISLLQENIEKEGGTFIGKPNEGSQGDSIRLIKDIKDLPNMQNVVVQ